jgi:hypothetical protein
VAVENAVGSHSKVYLSQELIFTVEARKLLTDMSCMHRTAGPEPEFNALKPLLAKNGGNLSDASNPPAL